MQCEATTESGNPCRAQPREGARWCNFHDPAGEAARAQSALAGGQARADQIARARATALAAAQSWWKLETADELEDADRWLARQALSGKVGAREAAAANAALRGLRASFNLADAVRAELEAKWKAYRVAKLDGDRAGSDGPNGA
jgi:hypothetical protein